MSRILFDNNDIGYLGLKKWLALRAAAELYKERVAEPRLSSYSGRHHFSIRNRVTRRHARKIQ